MPKKRAKAESKRGEKLILLSPLRKGLQVCTCSPFAVHALSITHGRRFVNTLFKKFLQYYFSRVAKIEQIMRLYTEKACVNAGIKHKYFKHY